MAHTTQLIPQGSRSELARFLWESYQGSYGDRPPSSSDVLAIRIDDRGKRDISPDFCRMSVLIQENATDRFTLYLKNPPLDDEVTEVIEAKNGIITGSIPRATAEIPLLIKEVVFLRELAKAIRRIVGPGRRYPVPNWFWVCPRTADSIDKLADCLMEYRAIRRHEPRRLASLPPLADRPASARWSPGGRVHGAEKPARSNQTGDGEDIFRLLGGQ